MRSTLFGLAIVLVGYQGARADGRPADALLAIVPPEAGLTVAVEDLGERSREVLASPMVDRLTRLPAVVAWGQGEGAKFVQARREIEAALGMTAEQLRDDLFGDAIVLALIAEAGRPAEQGSGLLLAKVADVDRLNRLIAVVNSSERQAGALAGLKTIDHNGASYVARRFGDGRPADYYAILGGSTFVWTNSESVVRRVIDQRADPALTSLGGSPRFRAIREGLPAGALATLYVDPRFVDRLLAESAEAQEEQPVLALIRDGIEPIDYAGAALLWDRGPIVRWRESIRPDRRRPGPSPAAGPALLKFVPSDTLAFATGSIDLAAWYDRFVKLVPESQRPTRELVETIARGLLLDRDPREEILPGIGPEFLVTVARPAADARLAEAPMSAWFALHGEPGRLAGRALFSAGRTVMALGPLDQKNAGRGLKLATSRTAAGELAQISGDDGTSLAIGLGDDRLVVGNRADVVIRSLDAGPGGPPPAFERTRASRFPGATAMAWADVAGLTAEVVARREVIADNLAERRQQGEAEARADLDALLGLAGLFESAFAAVERDPGGAWVERTIGLVGPAELPKPSRTAR